MRTFLLALLAALTVFLKIAGPAPAAFALQPATVLQDSPGAEEEEEEEDEEEDDEGGGW
jgi:ribosomal protein L12E/L44/L45/RPP1/RPP2